MNYSYVIIDDNQENVLETKAVADGFSELSFVGSANNYEEGLNLILESNPQLVFLEIDPANKKSNLSLALINELYRYLNVIPKIVITTSKKDLAFEAIQYQVTDYLLKPLTRIDFVKLVLKLNKTVAVKEIPAVEVVKEEEDEKPAYIVQHDAAPLTQPLILCIKSYGDYRYIDARDICYLQADNNSTDIHLNTGETVTAFKTLKHFESVLSFPFVRIHNSYIVNSQSISRIHTGNAVCYIKNSAAKIPFSKSYKTNIDLIISEISNGNYLEI
ncbi:LytR/AlgR family response regulator transcription factor [Flavobacterium sp. GSA192]|uniref:LytR/AlgR family response regulator transcription factor n=1 Tax=Flavobacterium sp. GSA192 TaxID=2576304 RepID=UPI00112720C0|nr:LytTR family DNA-binding domain-containing protein [Flavobacterium sp. GSA192]